MDKFFVTTPIYYVNDVPHIGNTCTTLMADIIARYQKLLGKEVFFLTGTDEHGNKVAQEAKDQGESPQDFCDRVSKKFAEAWPKLDIKYDYFIRTTDPEHERIASEIVQNIYDNGDVYKGKYEGPYCLGCEKFITETELENGKCPLHPGREILHQIEENYFFKLTKYVPALIKAIEDPTDDNHYEILPESKKSEVLARLKAGINDVSISRAQVSWGIPLPWDKTHTIYVWIEALLNYYTATRITKKDKYWPADMHTLAKDILWFHTVIWQAMLLSAGLALPKHILIHSYYLVDGQKMSKSLGNVIAPQDMLDKYGVDGTRFLIASTFPVFEDSDVSFTRFTAKYNSDLANGLGNLVARVAKMAERNGSVFQIPPTTVFDGEYQQFMEVGRLPEAVKLVWDWVRQVDEQISREQPWKTEGEEQGKLLVSYIRQIRKISYHLLPFMPQTATKILEVFTGPKIGAIPVLFPRIR